jgi:hypothetical protein
MHLLQSGVSLDMIRDFLGHVDIKTTQIYARANLEMKRKALEKISEPSLVQTIPSWQQISGVINSSNGGSTTLRNGPDVAAEANFDFYVCHKGASQGGWGGTSFAAPMAGNRP